MTVSVSLSVTDSAFAGGADPSGAADSTAAFQAALDEVAGNATGGSVHVPSGKYKIVGGLTFTGTAPLTITGDGPQASQLRLASTADSSTYFSITQTGTWGDQTGQDGTVIINGLSFHNDQYVGSFGATNIALYLDNVDFGGVYNCGFYKGTGSQRINQAIVLNQCNQVVVDNCNIFAAVNGVAFTGYCQVNAIRDTSIWMPSGTQVPTAAAVLFSGKTLGTHMRGVVLHDGDRGILWTRDAGGNDPHLFVGYDIEPNNHTIAAMEFDTGVHVYLSHCIFSGASVRADVPGLVFGPHFQGGALVDSCAFLGQPGHSVVINGGTGYKFQGCEFGGGGVYKYAPNVCDEINIASGVGQVSIDGCHFNTDSVAGLGNSNPPRSAVAVAAGATQVTLSNSKGAGAGYGTSAVLDLADAVLRRANFGLGLAETTTGSGRTVTTASSAVLGSPVTIPANDATAGTVYRLTCFGTGTQATGSAAGLTVQLSLGSVILGSFQPVTLPAAGSQFVWRYECDLYVTTAGRSGTLTPFGTFSWGASGAGPALTVHSGTGAAATAALDTTAANDLTLAAQWASAAGEPTISCACTLVERVTNYTTI